LGKSLRPRRLGGKTLFFVNTVLILIPLAYFGYQPLLRYSAILLIVDEKPQPGDAIVILGGGEPGRAAEAAELFKSGLAPRVVITTEASSEEYQEFLRKGITLVQSHENYVRVLHGMGVPADSIFQLKTPSDDSIEEIRNIREFAQMNSWKSIIIVTSNYHTRRSRLIARYVLDPDIRFSVTAARTGGLAPDIWWTRRNQVRTFLIEFEKLVAYTLYIWPQLIV
jgi:uncharacterized SAM-binding protein YcdF (DUF218 family)